MPPMSMVEVETAYVEPLFAPTRPVMVARTGALVKVCVPAHVLLVVVPKASEKLRLVERSPPPMSGYTAEKVVVWFAGVKPRAFCLLLKVVQLEAERRPPKRFVAEAVGILRVCTEPADVIPQPPSELVVAKVCEPPVRPFNEVMPLPAEPQSVPVPDTTPLASTWRHCVEPVTEAR